MIQTNSGSKLETQAEKNFKNIQKSIKGLYEILEINLSDKDFYLEAGEENLTGLYKNLLELLLNEYGLRKLVKKIKDSKQVIDINLEKLAIENDL
ncbi:MAG: hypothetical protein EU550_01765 [Promethearchaeota archaeon]|nr:MAG: hypothetical protein EU550_01765 [Candidatus Lokiarchaeota archaeon]